jgi:L-alanine-DL-glutamate epimerase-like enolase superfamily enzyme
VIVGLLGPAVIGHDALSPPAAWSDMIRATRNLGRPGIVSMAVAAVDTALWDLKARLLGLPLAVLLGAVRDRVPVYGSGGFTSYRLERLRTQFGDWAGRGITRVKMKVGPDPGADVDRVEAARQSIGPEVELFVDANGAYTRRHSPKRSVLPGQASAGSRNRSRRTTSKDCGCFATARPLPWTSPPANTATT